MPEFRVREQDAGEERTERRGKSDECHQKGDADDDEKGESGVHFPQSGGMDEPEQWAGEERAGQNDTADRGQCDKRRAPSGQALDQ